MVRFYNSYNPILTKKQIASCVNKHCVICKGIINEFYCCNCFEGPSILQLQIKKSHQDYFFMDGSVKPVIIKIRNLGFGMINFN